MRGGYSLFLTFKHASQRWGRPLRSLNNKRFVRERVSPIPCELTLRGCPQFRLFPDQDTNIHRMPNEPVHSLACGIGHAVKYFELFNPHKNPSQRCGIGIKLKSQMLLLYSHQSAATLPRLHCPDKVMVRLAGSSRHLNSNVVDLRNSFGERGTSVP